MYPVDNLEYTIDSIYKLLLENLTRDNKIHHVSQQLSAMAENEERVLFIYSFMKAYGIIPLVVKIIKCDYVSLLYRSRGNQCFQKKSLYEAILWYNMSLCYAPLLSESYALALANRSAALVALKKYKECLRDLSLVFSIRYPVNIRDKLLKRKRQCEETLRQNLRPDDICDGSDHVEEDPDYLEVLTLKSPRHDSYTAASSKLRVEYDIDIGRHVIANEDIEVGEVIVQEDPYVSMVLKNQLLYCCAFCTSRNFNLYPCPFCCYTMYCSRECSEKSWEEYHCFECPLIASLIKMNFSKLELLALRTTIKARTDHEDWECVFASVLDAETLIYTNHWGHVIVDGPQGDKWVYDSKYYSAIQTLCTNDEKRDISDIFQKCVSAAVLMHCLAVANFNKIDNENDILMKHRIKRFVAGALMLHMMTGPTNMHSITANVENEEGNFVDEYNIGGAPYAFLSLINHSCSPNVVRYNKLGSARMSLIALRPIKKGMMILDNYGYDEALLNEVRTNAMEISACEPSEQAESAVLAAFNRRKLKAHHAVHNRDERQAILKSQYKFNCECEACVNDWPVYQDLPEARDLPDHIARKKNELLNGDVIEALQKADQDRAMKLYKPLCELATALEPYIPCKELAECQETLKQCLAIMTGVLPHGCTKFIEWEVPPPQMPGTGLTSRYYTGHGARDLC